MKEALYQCRKTRKSIAIVERHTRPLTCDVHIGVTGKKFSTVAEYVLEIKKSGGFHTWLSSDLEELARGYEKQGMKRIL